MTTIVKRGWRVDDMNDRDVLETVDMSFFGKENFHENERIKPVRTKKLQVLRTHQSFVSLWSSIFAYSLVEGPKRSLLPKPTIPPLLVTHSNDCNLSSEERSLQHFSWWAMVLPQVESQELVSQRYSLNVRELTVSSTYHLLSLFFCHAPI